MPPTPICNSGARAGVAGGGQAVAEGDVKAIAPLIKVLDRLDRYQKTAGATRALRRKRPTAGDELVSEVYRRMRETLQEIEAERTSSNRHKPIVKMASSVCKRKKFSSALTRVTP